MTKYELLPWMVVTDVRAIQSFLFSTTRLATIAGASDIVVENDQAVERLAGDHTGEALFSAGGSAVSLFPTKEDALRFTDAASRGFEESSISGSLIASDPVEWSRDNFAQKRDQALESLESRKRMGGFKLGEVSQHPMARRCEVCGREPASIDWHIAADTIREIGPSCDNKRKKRGKSQLDRLSGDLPAIEGRPARDFNELAGSEYLGVIVADANNVGTKLRHIGDPRTYKDFSEALSGAVTGALAEALGVVMSGGLGPDDLLPVEILYCGGDDLVVACRGDLALPLARLFGNAFANRASALDIGISVGVVLCHPGFPFLMAHQIAERLMHETKRAIREEVERRKDPSQKEEVSLWNEGAIDFAIVSESLADADVLLADRAVKANDGSALYLTGKPYRLGTGPRSIDALRKACAALKKAEFPRSRLFDLRAMGTVRRLNLHADVFGSNLDKAAERLKNDLAYWQQRSARRSEDYKAWEQARSLLGMAEDGFYAGELRTAVPDLADAMDLWGDEANENRPSD